MKKNTIEVWKAILGYEGLYEVSNLARVRSVERDVIDYVDGKQRVRHLKEKIKEQTLDKKGYLTVKLSKNGVDERKKVHKLVAQAFIPNPNGYDTVHHINHIQTDNRIENLEWISKEEHDRLHESDRVEACSKTVYQFEDGKIVNVWESATEAARVLGFKQCAICECCRGGRYSKKRSKWINVKTSYGFGWSYNPLCYIERRKEEQELSLALS